MRDQRSPVEPPHPADEFDLNETAVFSILLDRHPAHVTMDELNRALVYAGRHASMNEVAVEDAVAHLVQDGLADRHDRYLVLTRAAVRGYEIRPG
jgi:hypothetical protein